MKRVLLIAYNDLNNSGVPNVIYQTIKALHEQYSFDVVIFGDDDYYYQKLKNENININLIKYIDNRPKSKFGRILWWLYERPRNHYLFMKNLLKNNSYSIVHSFKEYDCWPFFKAAKKNGIEKRIFHCNVNLAINRSSKLKILYFRNRRLSLKYASTLVGVSKLSCENAFGKRKYTVLYNSYDNQKYNMNVKNTLSEDELVITQVASYSDNKNQLFSLEVLKELKKLHANTRLNLVGASGNTPYYQELANYVKANDLEDSVSFIERSESVEKIYEKTTFAIIPSLREGFSLVAVEAQACGIDVFASSSVPNEIDCGGVTFLDLSKESVYWAECIYKRFVAKKNKRTSYRTDKFSFDIFKDNLIALYSKNGAI